MVQLWWEKSGDCALKNTAAAHSQTQLRVHAPLQLIPIEMGHVSIFSRTIEEFIATAYLSVVDSHACLHQVSARSCGPNGILPKYNEKMPLEISVPS